MTLPEPGGTLPGMVEKRRSKRVDVRGLLQVFFWVFGASYGEGKPEDLSRHGIRFKTHRPVDPWTELDLQVIFPESFQPEASFRARARVVRLIPGRRKDDLALGCEFVELSPEADAQVTRFVDWAEAREPRRKA